MDSVGALAPAMGASRIGVRKPNPEANALARSKAGFIGRLQIGTRFAAIT
jgi:hypothetical protein